MVIELHVVFGLFKATHKKYISGIIVFMNIAAPIPSLISPSLQLGGFLLHVSPAPELCGIVSWGPLWTPLTLHLPAVRRLSICFPVSPAEL